MVYHPSSNAYGTSAVKSVVEAWEQSIFTNNELKIVEEYSIRLINDADLINLGCSQFSPCGPTCGVLVWDTSNLVEWVKDSAGYWTMIQDGQSRTHYINAGLSTDDTGGNQTHRIRPVINVYKSKISS